MPAAASIHDVWKTLSPEPLRTPRELEEFYRGEVNTVRGQDLVKRLGLELRRAHAGREYKAFLIGHSGVGKSTELTRLIQEVDPQFRAIRFSATSELDPGSFQPFDVLLLLVAEVVARTAKPLDAGGAGKRPSEASLRALWDWFASERTIHKESTRIAAEVAAGAGVSIESWWAKILGLFANLKGEMKYASSRERETVEYRLNRLSVLIEAANRLLVECNELQRSTTGREWLFVGEDLDKPGISLDLIEKLFISYSNLFKALRAVLAARVDPSIFAEGQWTRLTVASGGNLRDLFSLVHQAADHAILRQAADARIAEPDVDFAVAQLRSEYLRRLGESEYDPEPIPYARKADRLVAIYRQDPAAQVPDAILYSLLQARAVQEFDGERWFGVHPLVVAIIEEQGKLQVSEKRVKGRKKAPIQDKGRPGKRGKKRKSEKKGKVPGGLE